MEARILTPLRAEPSRDRKDSDSRGKKKTRSKGESRESFVAFPVGSPGRPLVCVMTPARVRDCAPCGPEGPEEGSWGPAGSHRDVGAALVAKAAGGD